MTEQTIKPQDLVGKIGANYHDERGEIVAAVYFKDWEEIKEHDTSGWMYGDEFDEMLEAYDDDDILVALESDNGGYFGGPGVNVYVFGDEGVHLVEE